MPPPVVTVRSTVAAAWGGAVAISVVSDRTVKSRASNERRERRCDAREQQAKRPAERGPGRDCVCQDAEPFTSVGQINRRGDNGEKNEIRGVTDVEGLSRRRLRVKLSAADDAGHRAESKDKHRPKSWKKSCHVCAVEENWGRVFTLHNY